MEVILRTVFVYFFVLLGMRIAGKRTLSDMTAFDFLVMLLVSEATQEALLAGDGSITNAVLVILTFFAAGVLLSYLKLWSPRLEHLLDGSATIIVEDGKPIKERMRKERVDIFDVLESARETQGLERLDQIKYAVLERSGKISIIPKQHG